MLLTAEIDSDSNRIGLEQCRFMPFVEENRPPTCYYTLLSSSEIWVWVKAWTPKPWDPCSQQPCTFLGQPEGLPVLTRQGLEYTQMIQGYFSCWDRKSLFPASLDYKHDQNRLRTAKSAHACSLPLLNC